MVYGLGACEGSGLKGLGERLACAGCRGFWGA